MHEDRLADAGLGLELREQAVDVVDVPGALDLRDHDHVELVADLGDERRQVVEHPGALERVDPGPQLRVAEVDLVGDLDQALAGGDLVVDRDRVLEVAQQDVGLLGHVGDLGRHLLVRGVEEVDHPRGREGHLGDGLGGADRERLEELAWVSQGWTSFLCRGMRARAALSGGQGVAGASLDPRPARARQAPAAGGAGTVAGMESASWQIGPRSGGKILDLAFNIYFGNILRLLLASAVVVVPADHRADRDQRDRLRGARPARGGGPRRRRQHDPPGRLRPLQHPADRRRGVSVLAYLLVMGPHTRRPTLPISARRSPQPPRSGPPSASCTPCCGSRC